MDVELNRFAVVPTADVRSLRDGPFGPAARLAADVWRGLHSARTLPADDRRG